MAPTENPGDINSIPHFLAQHRARQPPAFDDPDDPWVTHPAFHTPDELPFHSHDRPASSGKTTSHYSDTPSSTVTCVPSVFSTTEPLTGTTNHTAWAANPADDHPDRRELSDHELHLLHQEVAAPGTVPLASYQIPCEFGRYTGCTATFDAFTQVEAWIRHELEDHLNYDRPAACLCWFCDDFKFVTELAGYGARVENFQRRMLHIAGHFQDGMVDARGMRPDFFFLDYLWDKKLIAQEVFERETEVHEAMQVEGLRPRGYRTKRMEKEEERRDGVIVDTRKEERERKREVRRARDKR